MVKADKNNFLVLIPARGGSKGVPKKNTKSFADGDSLVQRAIDIATSVFKLNQVIVSSDDLTALQQAKAKGVVALERSPELASDTSGMLEVMIDAIKQYGQNSTHLVLLQPTSPFRTAAHLEQAMSLMTDGDQAVVAVNEPKGHPFYTLFQQDGDYIHKFKKNEVVRRQDLPSVYDVNGLIYIFEIESLLKKSWVDFDFIKPLIVSSLIAMDIDTEQDWALAELIEKNKETIL